MAQENKGCLVEVQRCEWMPRIGTETEASPPISMGGLASNRHVPKSTLFIQGDDSKNMSPIHPKSEKHRRAVEI